jgi:hypothetical protein
VDSVLRSAAVAEGTDIEILLVWQSVDPPPRVAGVRTLDVFPVSLSYARNRGLSEARAHLVSFLDDDEVVELGYVANVLQAFCDRPDAVGVFGAVSPLDDDGVPYCVVEGDERLVFRGRRAPWRVGTGGNMAFRREALVGAGGFDLQTGVATPGRSGEDTDIILRFLRSGQTLLLDPDIVVLHPTKTEQEVWASRYPYGFGTGRVARRNRDAKVAAQYSASLVQAFVAAERNGNRQRRQESLETLRGFLAGALTPTRWAAPAAALQRLPAEVAAAVPGSLRALPVHFTGEPRFDYRGDGRVLHLHVNPPTDIEDAFRLREGLRLAGLPRIAPLHAAIAERDAFWVVEDDKTGRPAAGRQAQRWLPQVTDWAVDLARTAVSALTCADWTAERARLLGAASHALHPLLGKALDAVGACPQVPVHGDLRLANVQVTRTGLAITNWDHASARGLPGQDLLLLHATARTGHPNRALLQHVAEGGEHPLGRALEAAGLPKRLHAAGVLTAAALWAAEEAEARHCLGVRRLAPRVYGPLLERLASALA